MSMEAVTNLIKALEAGSYDAAPSTLVQGAALQIEDLSPIQEVLCFEDKHIKLQKVFGSKGCKTITPQFNRQLSYGQWGGSAHFEGNLGAEKTSEYVRMTASMAFYSHARRVTIASTMVATVDGQSSDDRAASDATKMMFGDIEFDAFAGADNFSNAGVFDGHPSAVADLPNMHGLQIHVRQSDSQANAKDLMFAEYGSSESVVLSAGGGVITQDRIEDMALRSALNLGNAETLYTDPTSLAAYNKIAFTKERIVLAGSPQGATGADLSKQWVSGGTVSIEGCQFLRGKFSPPSKGAKDAIPPSISLLAAAGGTLAAGDYWYVVSTIGINGESVGSTAVQVTGVALNDKVTVTITPAGGSVMAFNVYRSAAGGSAASAKFIGRVKAATSGTTAFVDLGNKAPGSVTASLVQKDSAEFKELAPYSRLKLAVTQLDIPEAHFTFKTLVVYKPRVNVLLDNIKGTIS